VNSTRRARSGSATGTLVPVDYVKLDRSLVCPLVHHPGAERDLAAIVAVARTHGIETIATFVADEDTVRILENHGVNYAQGFHVGTPEPARSALAGMS